MSYKIWGPPILAPSTDGRTVYLHGRRILSAPGEEGRHTCEVLVADVAAGRIARTIPLPECRVGSLLHSADEGTLYLDSWLIDLSGQPPAVLENPGLGQRAVTQSADRRWLYALDGSGAVTIWSADERRRVRDLPGVVEPFGSGVLLAHATIQASRDGSRLYVASDEGNRSTHALRRLVTIDLATGERLGEVRPDRPFYEFTVNPEGTEAYFVGPPPAGAPHGAGWWLEIRDLASGRLRASVAVNGGDLGPLLAPPAR